jgi:hypothetical protein
MDVSQRKIASLSDQLGLNTSSVNDGAHEISKDSSSLKEDLNIYHFEPKGDELIETVVRLSGVDENSMRRELESILAASGHMAESGTSGGSASSEITLDDLRASMLEYLEEMNRSMTMESE